MRLLEERVEPGALVFVVGGEGIVTELEKRGFRVTRSADDSPAAVVQGFAPDVGWRELAEASFALNAHGGPDSEESGIPWIATNMDWTIPVARGIAPGNGTLVSAVHTAVGRFPVVAGKPETPIFEEAKRRFGAERPLVVGDRLDTDILGANRAGMASAVVLTGIDRAKQVLAADAASRPDFILGDLRGLHEPYPVVETVRDGAVRVGKARVRVDGRRVVIVSDGDGGLDLLRAACAAIWQSGTKIHALDVPASLYR
jgi:glycerol 3-phosphatase-2